MCAFLGTKMGIFRKCLELTKMVRNAKIIVLTQSLIVSHNDQILVSDSIPVSHSIQYEILLASLVLWSDFHAFIALPRGLATISNCLFSWLTHIDFVSPQPHLFLVEIDFSKFQVCNNVQNLFSTRNICNNFFNDSF